MTAVFLTFHGISHFNASFRIARLLSKTHTVVFAAFPGFQNYVESQGFIFYPLKSVPFGLGFEEWVNEQEYKSNLWLRSLRDRWNGRLFKKRDNELRSLIDDLHPTTIIIDAQQPTDFVVLYPYLVRRQIKTVLLHTMLPHVLRKGYPPGNTMIVPDNPTAVRRATLRYKWTHRFKKIISAVKYAGKTNQSMVRSVMRSNGMPLTYLSKSLSHLSIHINGPDEFILAPKEFDFSFGARTPVEHYVGFMIDRDRREHIRDEVANLIDHVAQNKIPLVYCSLGTVSGGDETFVKCFLEKFIEAVASMPIVAAISTMALGKTDYRLPRPTNVYFLNPAPQLAVLSKASVFVTHAGINSIKESIHAGVPMLAYARDPRLDQFGNAARIAFAGLGLVGDIKNDVAADISSNITQLLTNPQYKNRVNEFRKIDSAYDDEHFMELFHAITPLKQSI